MLNINVKIISLGVPFTKTGGIILAHNLLSGNKNPSDSDRLLIRRLKHVCENLDIHIFDHIVVTNDGYFSFAVEGII